MLKDNSQILSWVKFFLGWPLSVIAIIYILRFLINRGGEALSNISGINLSFLLLSFLLFLVWFLIRAYVWQIFLKGEGYDLSLKETIYGWEFSELKRFVPGNVWSFLGRASLFDDLGVPKKVTVKGLMYEIELIVVASLLLSTLSISLVMEYFGLRSFYVTIFISFSTILTTVIFLFSAKLPFGKLKTILPNLNFKDNLRFLFLYTASCFFFGAGTFFAAHSIILLDFSRFFEYVGFFSFSLLVGYLSVVTPSGLGVREAIITFGLSKIISIPQAALIAIFARIVLIISELLFLLLVFIWKKLSIK